MDKNLIMFGSVTLAMKCRELLRNNGIISKLVRTPLKLRQKSCGYSLFVPADFEFAMEIIGRYKIPILGTAAVDIQ